MNRKKLLTILFVIFIILNIALLYFIFIEPRGSETLQTDNDIEYEIPIPEGGFDVVESSEELDIEMEEDTDFDDLNGDLEDMEEDYFDSMEELDD